MEGLATVLMWATIAATQYQRIVSSPKDSDVTPTVSNWTIGDNLETFKDDDEQSAIDFITIVCDEVLLHFLAKFVWLIIRKIASINWLHEIFTDEYQNIAFSYIMENVSPIAHIAVDYIIKGSTATIFDQQKTSTVERIRSPNNYEPSTKKCIKNVFVRIVTFLVIKLAKFIIQKIAGINQVKKLFTDEYQKYALSQILKIVSPFVTAAVDFIIDGLTANLRAQKYPSSVARV